MIDPSVVTKEKPLTVLVIGSPKSAARIIKLIEKLRPFLGFKLEFEERESYVTARNLMLKQPFDLILSRYKLRINRTADDVTKIIEEHSPLTQLALFTPDEEFEQGVFMVQKGALDCVNMDDPEIEGQLIKLLVNANYNTIIIKNAVVEALLIGSKTVERIFTQLLYGTEHPVRNTSINDPLQALEEIERHHWDLIIVEDNIEGGGIELCERIRNVDEGVPILYWGRESNKELTMEALRRGANYFYWHNNVHCKISEVLDDVYSLALKEAVKRSVRGATIEELFLFHRYGTPIATFDFHGLETDVDNTLVAGFLTAITSFVGEIFQGEVGYLLADKYGVAFRSDGDIIAAVVFKKNDNIQLIQSFIEELIDRTKQFLRQLSILGEGNTIETNRLVPYQIELSKKLASFVQQVGTTSQITLPISFPQIIHDITDVPKISPIKRKRDQKKEEEEKAEKAEK
ncbi:MAG: response regulator, partial [Candidatus Heimdallarchaeota archaeon]|nr:response regulator [Candidatus Heimdallarchaeota archaeon]MCK5049897.1 response regulator [Candidatus Heimdallarchaeota archaeon]